MATARVLVEVSAEATRSLPITLEPAPDRGSLIVAGIFIALAAAILLAPFSLLLAQAAQDPSSFLATMQQPATAVQLGLALIVAIAFVAMPLRRLIRTAQLPRRIVISATTVNAASDAHGTPAWSEPLSAYRGIAHHIRSSLSGAQHEIVLVHPDLSRSVILQAAPRIDQSQLDAMAALLNVGEVPARALYEGRRTHAWIAQPAIELKAA